jgi:putative peptidoglycan lipid II flippase
MAQQRLAFFIVPCAVAFVALGHVVAGAVFQTGQFTARDSRYVWALLAGSAIGLQAATMARLTSSAFYALGDTKTPLRIALVRVGLGIALGFGAALVGPHLLGIEPRWGAVGLTAMSGFAAWVEFVLLRRRLAGLIGAAPFAPRYLAQLWLAAAAAAAAGWSILLLGGDQLGPIVAAAAVLGPYAAVYGALTLLFGVPTAQAIAAQVRRRG